MKSTFLTATLCLTLAACGNTDPQKDAVRSTNDTKSGMTGAADDKRFVAAASDGGLMEVKLGQLAQQNAASQQVKDFGNMMVTDHSAANSELAQIAQKKGLPVLTTLTDKHQKDYNGLADKKGADFDKAYTDYMVKDHEEDIDEFKKEAATGDDKELKAWAESKVPVLQHHLEMAKEARDVVKR